MLHLPTPQPNFERLYKVLLRQGEPDKVPIVELFHDGEIREAILPQLPGDDGPDDAERPYRRLIRFWHQLGYDYLSVGAGYAMPTSWNSTDDTADLKRERRSWINEDQGLIANREDFERYPWPDLSQPPDLSHYEIVARNLPEGMKIIGTTCGVLEYVMWILGYAPFALMLKDDPELVRDIFDRVGATMVRIYESIAPLECVGAVWLGDDMGYKHSTMISPAALREYVFPWQKKLAAVAHASGKPFILHSCGYLEEIMPDLVEDVQIDARHSFEDGITPVADAKRHWGDHVAVLGGIDVDYLCRATPDQVKQRVRKTLEDCASGGGYALGTGNSVANYIPVENFLAMLEGGREFGRY